MSRKSSLNLSRLLSMLDWRRNGGCVHATLTYGRTWPRTKDELASVKAALVARLGEAGLCGIWRLEFQKRGAPHFHCLLWIGDRDPNDVAGWLASWWAGFSGNRSRFGCKVTIGDQTRAAWYLAMHAAKREQSPPFAVGRWWGYIDRERVLAASDLHSHGEVTERERVWWARLYRRATGSRTRNNAGLSWFLPRVWQCEVHAWIMRRIGDELHERHCPRPPF